MKLGVGIKDHIDDVSTKESIVAYNPFNNTFYIYVAVKYRL